MNTGTTRKRPHPLTSKFNGVRPWCAYLLAISIVAYGFAPMIASSQTVVVSGNIHPDYIEIDSSANHYQGVGTILNTGAGRTFVDWVQDSNANSDPASLSGGIATGLISGLTAAANGTGHWNGVRIVDRFASADQDIFTSGGKVNEPENWQVGPGSVGSAKFDSTQMFLANNQANLFFGMERRGNDGTTAFDFEFNQLPPRDDFEDDPKTKNVNEADLNGYVPVRSDGDVLISFQLNGSGGDSGSVNIYIFRFAGGLYAPFCDDDPATNGTGEGACAGELISSINSIDATTPEPWGYVKGSSGWVLTPDIERRIFAEAQVPLSFLPGVNNCGGTAFVAIRTRSSVALTSDAKDTTKYFQYSFGGPTAIASLTGSCDLRINFDGDASTNSSGDASDANGLTYAWTFYKGATQVGTSTAKSGFIDISDGADVAGEYHATLVVTEGGAGGCNDSADTNTVDVRRPLGATASKTNSFLPMSGTADSGFGVAMTGVAQNLFAGDGDPSYQWQKKTGAGNAETDYENLSGKTNSILSYSLADLQNPLIGTLSSVNTPTQLLTGEFYKYQKYTFTGRVKVSRTVNGLTCPANSNDVTVHGLKAIDP